MSEYSIAIHTNAAPPAALRAVADENMTGVTVSVADLRGGEFTVEFSNAKDRFILEGRIWRLEEYWSMEDREVFPTIADEIESYDYAVTLEVIGGVPKSLTFAVCDFISKSTRRLDGVTRLPDFDELLDADGTRAALRGYFGEGCLSTFFRSGAASFLVLCGMFHTFN